MKINKEIQLDFQDVLILPQRTLHASRKEVLLEREFKFYHSPRTWKGIPVCISNLTTTGCIDVANVARQFKIITVLHKYHTIDELIKFYKDDDKDCFNKREYVWVSIGMNLDDIKKIKSLSYSVSYTPNIVVDVANGYMDTFVSFLSKVRNEFPEAIIMAGNTVSPDMISEYIIHGGVDICKVGIGSGSRCMTRIVTGIGRPQLSSISDCSHKAHGLKSEEKRLGLICSDGGCKEIGDVCKAFAANSDFVMLGGYFNAAKECDGQWRNIEKTIYPTNGKEPLIIYKIASLPLDENSELKCFGMSSEQAMLQFNKKKEDYKASEGDCVWIRNKGPIANLIKDLLGGIRSCCTYIGATTIKDMSRCSEFILVNRVK